MKATITFLCIGLVCLFTGSGLEAQQPLAAAAEPEAPLLNSRPEGEPSALRLIQFSGVVKDGLGNPRTGVVGLTFALYKEQQGGAPLWLETQNVTPDEQGHYTVLLGSTTSEGLPVELFSAGEARWLGYRPTSPTSWSSRARCW